jgi:hypothetical protein
LIARRLQRLPVRQRVAALAFPANGPGALQQAGSPSSPIRMHLA